jgi:hypothetical protein
VGFQGGVGQGQMPGVPLFHNPLLYNADRRVKKPRGPGVFFRRDEGGGNGSAAGLLSGQYIAIILICRKNLSFSMVQDEPRFENWFLFPGLSLP